MKTLWGLQLENIAFIKEKKRCIIADEVGLGKTITGVAFIREERLSNFLICCPLAVVGQWLLTLREEAGIEATVLKGKKPCEIPEEGAYIIQYDLIHHWFDQLNHYRQLLMLDESQYTGNPKAKRTKCIMAFANNSHYLVGMSATPFRTYPKQLWPILHMIDPKKWGSSWSFYARYCGLTRGRFGITYDGATNMNELRERTKPVMIAHKNTQKFQRIELWHFVDWDKKYDAAAELDELEKLNAAALYTKMAQMQMVNFDRKAKAVIDWVLNYPDPLIVFYWHNAVGDYLKLHLKCPLFDGRTPPDTRKHLLANLPNVMGMNIASGGVGIDGLQNKYATAAFVEFGYSPADIKQAIGRIARTGQKKPVKIYLHGALDTSDELFLGRIDSRFGIINKVFNNMSASYLQENNLFNLKENH